MAKSIDDGIELDFGGENIPTYSSNSRQRYLSDYENQSSNQYRANADASDRAADRVNDRSLNFTRQSNLTSESNRDAELNRQQGLNREDRQFKADESDKDRKKSSSEFTQNRYQQQFNSAQDRSNLEFSTNKAQENLKTTQDAETLRAKMGIDRDTGLANISQQTAFADQKANIERAKLQAQAQVSAALYGARQTYVNYS